MNCIWFGMKFVYAFGQSEPFLSASNQIHETGFFKLLWNNIFMDQQPNKLFFLKIIVITSTSGQLLLEFIKGETERDLKGQFRY